MVIVLPGEIDYEDLALRIDSLERKRNLESPRDIDEPPTRLQNGVCLGISLTALLLAGATLYHQINRAIFPSEDSQLQMQAAQVDNSKKVYADTSKRDYLDTSKRTAPNNPEKSLEEYNLAKN